MGVSVAVLLSVVGFLGLAGVVYLRGYLIPGTPWLTRTYFPDWLLRRFDKGPTDPRRAGAEEIDLERFLMSTGTVTECAHEDDLCLTDEFRSVWRERIVQLREGNGTREQLAAILDVDPSSLSFDEFDDAFIARLGGHRVGAWESHAAFLADMAASTKFEERSDEWDALDRQSKSSILNGLRVFLDRCPACDGRATPEEDIVQSCCRSARVVAVTCQLCGARLFEVEHPEA